jgi:hypothetical protein
MFRRIARSALIFSFAITPNLTAQAKPNANPAVKPVWPGEGPMKWAPRPTVPAITANDLRTRLYGIADDSMEGRRIGERGNFKTTTYIASEFKRLGLKPAGDNGTYFQVLDFGPSGVDSTKARLSIAGTALAARTDWMPVLPSAANGVSAKVDLQNVATVFAGRMGDTSVVLDPAVFRGKVAVFVGAAGTGNAPGGGRGAGGGGRGAGGGGGAALAVCSADLGWPNQRGAADALGFVPTNAMRMTPYTPPATSNAPATTPPAGRGNGRGNAAASPTARMIAAGIVGYVVSQDAIAPNAAFGTNARGGMFPTIPAGGIPGATITAATAQKIFGKPVDQLTIGTVGQPISANWVYESHVSETPARNVIAILPGSDPKLAGEYVLVGAHNDHNGVNGTAVDHDSLRAYNTIMRPMGANSDAALSCRPNERQQFLIDSLLKRARSIRPPRRDSVMNGADDDGSGTVVLMEIAEAFAKEHPKRSIIFISHQGEEAGLLGSKWFVDHPTVVLDSIVAAHNMDMLGKGHEYDVKFGGPNSVQTLGSRRMSREFGDIIDSVNAISKEPMAIDKTWEVKENPLNRFCRSDQVNYVNKNIPVTYFSLGYARDYHQPTDEPQYIDYDHAARLARFIHDVMTAVADRKDRPFKDGPDPTMPNCGR